MKRALAWVFILSFAGLQGGSARPSTFPVDLPDTPLTSNNVHLLATFPTGMGVGGHFLGHYFFQTTARPGGFIPGTASAGGVWSFDVADPENPVVADYLALPHWENEDVDLSPERKILLVTAERTSLSRCESAAVAAEQDKTKCTALPPKLSVIDISDPTHLSLRSELELPAFAGADKNGQPLRGPGHTAACVLKCQFAYLSASRANQGVYVIDLRNLDHPRIHGQVWNSPAAAPSASFSDKGYLHDVNIDTRGYVWMAGSGGTALYAPLTIKTLLRPRLLAYGKAITKDLEHPNKYNALIHHAAVPLNATQVMVDEESFSAQCGWHRNAVDDALRDDEQEGSFQIWQISGAKLTPVSTWKSEVAEYADGGGIAPSCSSHWFSINRYKTVAIGWYDQGTRFLDVSNPKHIRQIGYWISHEGSSSAAYFHPSRPDLVYVADFNRGLDVLKIDRGGRGAPTLVAPMRAEWFTNYRGVRFTPQMKPDPDFGYACMRPERVDW
jgi:hypothetical protein